MGVEFPLYLCKNEVLSPFPVVEIEIQLSSPCCQFCCHSIIKMIGSTVHHRVAKGTKGTAPKRLSVFSSELQRIGANP
jgi:hypothetical protein